ncbi:MULTISPECIES: salicylate synthase [Sporomusa]|uniref:salicylate synthase n=1 Tax=Sporomusa TaxID=2375 RepID=UPI0016652A09|nr:salicylate synthase [Sporomusa sp. GT1]
MKVNKEWGAQVEIQYGQPDNPTAYIEKTINFAGDAHLAASQIAESGLFINYLLYENKGELSLGMGIHAVLSVDSAYTTLKTGDKTLQFKNGRLSETIDTALQSVRLKNWRAYGRANFGLARYNHKMPLLTEDECLLQLFIPEVELRFTKGSIQLRALKEDKLAELSRLVRTLAGTESSSLAKRTDGSKLEVSGINTTNSENYLRIVADAVQEIGECKYQKVILSRKIPLDRELDLVASYIAGRKVNSPARSFLLSMDGLTAAGFSPETVVEVDSQGWVSTQPLAGTRAKGCSEAEEKTLREELLHDPKEIAEHAVSVKLAFEELGSVCDTETIAVSDFMSVANRGTVQHIASRLKGKLKSGYNSWHAFNALFPAVTASGIPKKEAIEAIGRLESHPRNLYSGCVMTFDSDGTMDAALVLRTVFQKDKSAWLHVGAGIVAMSTPSRELEETCEKLGSFSRQLVSPAVEQYTAMAVGAIHRRE